MGVSISIFTFAVVAAFVTGGACVLIERKRRASKSDAPDVLSQRSPKLATLSHELRTPLNGIIGMSELALGTPLSEEQRDYLETIRVSGQGLLATINDLLEFEQIQAGEVTLETGEIAVHELFRHTVRALAPQAHAKALELSCAIDPLVPIRARGDGRRIRQVLANLLSNAIKFTENGRITVRVRARDDGGVLVAVSDTGIGIAPEMQHKIFEAFTQVDGSIARMYGGTGLGLSISSHLVKRMGGRIWVESALGAGSTFHFEVPLQRAEGSSTSDLPGDISMVQAPRSVPPRRILLAEDNAVNRRFVINVLRRRGHVVVPAGTGREAIEALEREHFDLVLMDIQMPEMDGLEATRRIREIERTSGMHHLIIALTALARRGDREMCLAAGMDGYLSKPVDTDDLVAAVEAHADEVASKTDEVVQKIPAAQVAPALNLTNRLSLVPLSGAASLRPSDASQADDGPTVSDLPPPAPIVDFESFRERTEGNLELARELITLFRDESSKLLDEIQRAIDAGDARSLERAAHSLKGAVGYFYHRDRVSAARKLEEIGKAQDLSRAPELAGDLKAEMQQLWNVLPELEARCEACAS